MSDKHFVGLDLTGVEDNGKEKPISRITFQVDDDTYITAGDDTGRELLSECPIATQEMADEILSRLKGYQYQMFTADGVNIDPAAELGDGITAGGVYSVISRISDDGGGYPSISAPGEAELEDEFPSAGPMTREFNRKLAQTRSLITKTAEEIRLEVQNEVQGLSSSIDIQLQSITATVQGLDGQMSSIAQSVDSITQTVQGLEGSYSSLEQYVDSLTLSVKSGATSSTIQLMAGSAVIDSEKITFSGFVTFTGLSKGTTTIDGACIKTGTIAAKHLELTGAITWSDLDSATQNTINNAASTASSASLTAQSASLAAQSAYNMASGIQIPDYIQSTYIDSTTVRSPTIQGGTVTGAVVYFGASGSVGSLSYTRGNDGQSYTDLVALQSTVGMMIAASTNMRLGAYSLWIDVDISRIFVKKNGTWAGLAAAIQ